MTGKSSKTIYGRKVLFNDLLSRELERSIFRIDAFFECAKQDQIMSMRISNNQQVYLGINISFKEENFFLDSNEPITLSIIYRTYFIANYIRCLETAKETVPNSFFSGLVVLESIVDLYSNEKATANSPIVYSKIKDLSPIDVYCAIRAITRVLLEYNNYISGNTKEKCERYINILISYTRLPEIEYLGSKNASYTVLNDISSIRTLARKHPEIIRDCVLFSRCEITSLDLMKIEYVLQACDRNEDKFWPGMIMRLLSLADSKTKFIKYIGHPSLMISCSEFRTNSVAFYKEIEEKSILLRDNWMAIQYLARSIEQLMGLDVCADSGMVHFIQ